MPENTTIVKTLKHFIEAVYIVIILVMAAATIIEKFYGQTTIYASAWFATLWALLSVAGVCYIFRKKLYKRPVVFCMHIALVLILIGALTTHIVGERGQVHLRLDATCRSYIVKSNDGSEMPAQLPFSVKLDSFAVLMYPGTQSPMDYISLITITDGAQTSKQQISMNNVAEYGGYRFYQSGYDYDERGTILALSHDPWGIGLSYAGYFMLFASMLLLLILPNEGFRKALRKISATAATLLLLLISNQVVAQPQTLSPKAAAEMCNLYVYYNERICPLQTVAKDFTTKLYGKSSYKGLTAEQVFTGWCFYPYSWKDEPMIKVKMGDKKYVSYSELSKRTNSTIDDEKINIIRMLIGGQLTRVFPYEDNKQLTWFSPTDNLPIGMPEAEWNFVRRSFDYLGELAVTEKSDDKFIETIGKIRKYQTKNAADTLPSDMRFGAEKLYNKLDYTRPLSMTLATIGIVAFIFFVIKWAGGKVIHRGIILSLNIIVALTAVYLLLVMTLRGYVANHLPITNGYETMQFMALTTLVITLIMQRKFVLIFPFGLLITGLSLMVSMFGESNPQITNLMPVLASPLLSVHVCVIMVAYSLLAFMMFNGITALIMELKGKKQQSEHLYFISRALLYPALFLLTIGIFIGAIWANQSWGRYWGWDPKEVWALITMMVYAIPLHSSIIPQLQKSKPFHLFAIIAFFTVLMTYFGVNFLLGGMHSYANS